MSADPTIILRAETRTDIRPLTKRSTSPLPITQAPNPFFMHRPLMLEEMVPRNDEANAVHRLIDGGQATRISALDATARQA